MRAADILELAKVKITFLSTLTAAAGYLLAAESPGWSLVGVSVGVFLLASGSAVFNHLQDRSYDRRMERTKHRPLPSGRVAPGQAAFLGIGLVLAGFIFLATPGESGPVILGLIALFWYNGVYTYLKRITPFAAVPGALVGAIPPVMGWTAAGGQILDPAILSVAFFFFVWQVPHFWLLLLIHGRDYRRAGYPALTDVFSSPQLKRITAVWMVATATACLLLPFFRVIHSPVVMLGIMMAAVWLLRDSLRLLGVGSRQISFGWAFREINFYALSVILLVIFGRLVEML